jgi:2-oxoglutarate ferredoxin oxidoreductase subunit alpha
MVTGVSMPESALAVRKTAPVINDVVIEIATSNGSGSQSANLVLTRSIFQMGVPVSAKNLFPSNIQGLPTWFTIRANKDGWTARRAETNVMICMNPESVKEDLAGLTPGSVVVLRDDLAGFLDRLDLHVVVVPFTELVVPVCEVARLRKLVINMMYVGVMAHLMGIEMEEIRKAINKQFGSKPKAAEMNINAVEAAYKWALENLEPLNEYRFERMNATTGKILIEGNRACAMGAVWGGLTVLAWYPITPSSSVAEQTIDLMQDYRHDEQGRATYAVLQAEDELAAMGMVLGAGWAGARSMTTTSGPGISLMAEQAGLSYFAEIPAVIIDVQRMGPSTGLPTRTAQNDILKAYFLSHGDCKHLLLIPGDPKECFDFSCEAFNVAERFQTLVFVMTDLDLGMNLWMSDPFDQPAKPIDRGKVLNAKQLEELSGFKRYGDVDGDGIPYRTLPGTDHPKAAYFTRGTGHTDRATYSEKPEDWQENIDRLTRKFETARRELPAPIVHRMKGAEFGVVAYGTSDAAVREALHILHDEHGLAVDYLRMRALPAHADVKRFIEEHKYVYVVDQSRDAQMAFILRGEWPELAPRMRSVRHYNGMSIDAETIVNQIQALEHIQEASSPAVKQAAQTLANEVAADVEQGEAEKGAIE